MELWAKKTCAWAVTALLGAATIGWSLFAGEVMGGERDEGLVARLRAGGAEVQFLGSRGSLDGWLVSPRGKSPYTLYVDESGHGVMGLLFAPDGRELTGWQVEAARKVVEGPGDGRVADKGQGALKGAASQGRRSRTETGRMPPEITASRFAPRTETEGVESSYLRLLAEKHRAAVAPEGLAQGRTSVPADRLLSGIFEAAFAVEGFDLGEVGPKVAIFADPTCLPSRMAVAELARRALDGGIRLRVVPVGARGVDAEAMATLVLGSEDRARTWFTLDREDEWPALNSDAAAGVALNRRLFERTGSQFVPYSLMREPDGRVASAVGADFSAWFGKGAAR